MNAILYDEQNNSWRSFQSDTISCRCSSEFLTESKHFQHFVDVDANPDFI